MKPPLLCYLCGKPATTKDHVPPKTLFAPPRPHNLITLPCCAECNGAYALDEEYFRNNISMISDHRNAREIWEATRRSYKRNPKILADIDKRILPVKAGPILLPAVRFDAARTNRVLIKIARGLVCHHTGRKLPQQVKTEVFLDPQISDQLHDWIRGLPFRNRWGTRFSYVGMMAQDEADVGCWFLVFYVSKVFVVSFGTEAEPTVPAS